MTCEIAIMNRQAIALAADSAVTITQWIDGKKEQRFFKGTNKIFQLSNYHPVGIMIFGASMLHEIPWELIIKEFRTHLADKSFNDLSGYANELFDYTKNHSALFSHEYQERIFKEEANKIVYMHLYYAGEYEAVKTASSDEDKKKAYQDYILTSLKALDSVSLPNQIDQNDIDKAIAVYGTDIDSYIQSMLPHSQLQDIVDSNEFAQLVIKSLLKRYSGLMSSTGIVIAGFGDNDYFPGYEEYECYGILLEKCLYEKKGMQKIDVDMPSFIKPFATTAMIDTLLMGFSPDVYTKIQNELQNSLTSFIERIKNELKIADIPNLSDVVKKTVDEHTDKWTKAALDAHLWPLRRVIGSLPVDEMSELAETLIMLESLKEKVTKPTESVSGPIDVAVISKEEGFIWIKRKHYFDPKLNPRFFQRVSER